MSETVAKFNVYLRKDHQFIRSFTYRKDAVYWCKVNQISLLPDGEWGDDYIIEEEQPLTEDEVNRILNKAV